MRKEMEVEDKKKEEVIKADEILTKEEIQGMITLVIILTLGWVSVLAPVWWVRIVGWIVLGLTALSTWKVGKGIKLRMTESSIADASRRQRLKEQDLKMKEKESELKKKEALLN